MHSAGTELSSSFKSIINSLRTGDYGTASSELNETLQILQMELSRKKTAPQNLQKLAISLETMFLMQKMEDWVAVADILEYEFTAIWEELMRS